MKVVRTVRFAAAVAACSVLLLSTTGIFLRAAPEPGFQPKYAKLPLSFEENRGQAPADVRYLSRTRGGILLLRPDSFSLEADGGRPIAMRFESLLSSSGGEDEEETRPAQAAFMASSRVPRARSTETRDPGRFASPSRRPGSRCRAR